MIIGKSLTALGGGGLKPEIRVTAKAGALLNLHYKDSSIILQSYQLGAEETQHAFVVCVSETAYVVEDTTNGKSVEVLVDAVAQYSVEIAYNLWLYRDGDECEDITGGWVKFESSDRWTIGFKTANVLTDILRKYKTIHFQFEIKQNTGSYYYFGFQGATIKCFTNDHFEGSSGVMECSGEYGTNISDGKIYFAVGHNTNGSLTLTRQKLSNALYIYKSQLSNTSYGDLYVYKVWLE